MILQINTKAKTIRVEDQPTFSELVEQLEALLPEGAWKTYRIVPYYSYYPSYQTGVTVSNPYTFTLDGTQPYSVTLDGTPIVQSF